MTNYLVALDTFHGPLDLLLYLVKRNEVDVLDVPVAKLADQFLEFLAAVREVDVELAGDFLVMAATLMEIKARSLLPAEPEPGEEDEPDPRRELVKQLLEYRRFKDAAAALEERAEKRAPGWRGWRRRSRRSRGSSRCGRSSCGTWSSAFARLMRETQALQPTAVVVDDTPQHVYEEQVRGAGPGGGPAGVPRPVRPAAPQGPADRAVPGGAGTDQGPRAGPGAAGAVRRNLADRGPGPLLPAGERG